MLKIISIQQFINALRLKHPTNISGLRGKHSLRKMVINRIYDGNSVIIRLTRKKAMKSYRLQQLAEKPEITLP